MVKSKPNVSGPNTLPLIRNVYTIEVEVWALSILLNCELNKLADGNIIPHPSPPIIPETKIMPILVNLVNINKSNPNVNKPRDIFIGTVLMVFLLPIIDAAIAILKA